MMRIIDKVAVAPYNGNAASPPQIPPAGQPIMSIGSQPADIQTSPQQNVRDVGIVAGIAGGGIIAFVIYLRRGPKSKNAQ